MCGIVGIYNFKRNNLRQNFIQWCLHTMRHRGPDKQSAWDNGENYITGFARLSIRDLSANGDQPMLSDCKNYCITFNGEIYNTGELKNLLKPYFTQFKSTSDTEVLLYALIHLGIKKTLEIADGIFAFAFYDQEKNTLILARDRIGVKPLYAGISTDEVVYSSQYDHIMNHPSFSSASLDESAVGNYLQLGYISENYAAFKNTKLLKHGYWYIVNDQGFSEHIYYDYPVNSTPVNKNCLDEVIGKSVSDQLVSDVPLGTFMSGGVDSTLVTSFANQTKKINSFTIGIENSSLDESYNAEIYSKIFKTDHQHKFFRKRLCKCFCIFIDGHVAII